MDGMLIRQAKIPYTSSYSPPHVAHRLWSEHAVPLIGPHENYKIQDKGQ